MFLLKKRGLTAEGKEHQTTCNPLPTGSSRFCQMWHESHLLTALLPLGDRGALQEATQLQGRVHKVSRMNSARKKKKKLSTDHDFPDQKDY